MRAYLANMLRFCNKHLISIGFNLFFQIIPLASSI